MENISVSDPQFAAYGALLDIDAENIVSYLKHKAQMPKEGNLYVRMILR